MEAKRNVENLVFTGFGTFFAQTTEPHKCYNSYDLHMEKYNEFLIFE